MVFYRGKTGFRRKARNIARTSKRGMVKRYYNKNKRGRKSLNIGRVAADLVRIKRSLNVERKTVVQHLIKEVPPKIADLPAGYEGLHTLEYMKCNPDVNNPVCSTLSRVKQGDSALLRTGNQIKYTHATIKCRLNINNNYGMRSVPADPLGLSIATNKAFVTQPPSRFKMMLVSLTNGEQFDSDISNPLNGFSRYFHPFIEEGTFPASKCYPRRTASSKNMKILWSRTMYHPGQRDPEEKNLEKYYQFNVPLNIRQSYLIEDDNSEHASVSGANPTELFDKLSFNEQSYTSETQEAVAQRCFQPNCKTMKTNSLHLLVFSDFKRDRPLQFESGEGVKGFEPSYSLDTQAYLSFVDN